MALKHAQPGEVVHLRPLGDDLAGAKSSAIVRTPSFEAIRLIVPAGAELSAHQMPGRIMPHCLEGHVKLGLSSGSVELGAGGWL